jgi:hypothetical protein
MPKPNLFPRVKGQIGSLTPISGKVKNLPIKGSIGTSARYPIYTGPTEITPSTFTQILFTQGKNVNSNITIYPVSFNLQNKATEPSAHEDITLYPDEGYDGLYRVTVLKIPYEEIDNSLGGKTAKIAR